MRLLFVSHSFPPPERQLSNVGGMQRVATELHAALEQQPGLELHDLLLHSTWNATHLRTPAFLTKVFLQIRRMAEERAIDAVLFSSMVTAAMAIPLRKVLARNGIATAAIVHGRDVTLPVMPYQWLVPRIFDALDAVLPVSRATGEACLERGLDADKLYVVPNGVDLNRFVPLNDRATMRRSLTEALSEQAPLPEDALLLCSVGRQVERKGFAWFIDKVMPLLPPDVHYWLAGEGPETPNIAAAIERRGLQDRVRLLGRISDANLEHLYRGADLFVMPNIPVPGDMEGFGVVMLEAGLSGLPVIASRLEGIQDVVTEGANGHLIESGDAWGFSEAVMAYHHNRTALDEASAQAVAYVQDTFSWPAVAHRYVETLAAVAGVPMPGEAVEELA